ncbi:MAG: hypothetical protein EBV15_04510 [Bacteroidetes bacterium]|nr:hypothetical protein [Bacteroidota bacterium]
MEKVLKSKPVEAHGSMQMQHMLNRRYGVADNNQMYNYVLSGNLNLKLFGVIDAPFQMLFSNMGSRFTQPTYNQTAFHPQYKWAKLHLGRIAVNWSPQTVGGHVFQGVASDLTPGNLTFSALYGRFQQAVSAPLDSVSGNVMPSYRRMGYGFRAGYRQKNTHMQATYFQATDDNGSLKIGPEMELKPLYNRVWGVLCDHVLFKKLMLHATWNRSFLIHDLHERQTASLKQHYMGSVTWQGQKYQWNVTYEHTDPDYRTLGAYYFNNDMENVSVGGNVQALKGKLNLSGQAGLQRDNLDNRKSSSMRRWVYSLQVQCRLSKSSMLSGSYSSFTSFTNTRPFTDYLQPSNPMLAWDTLNFREISESGNVQLSLPMPKWGKWQGSFSGNGLWQRNAGAYGSKSDFYNTGIGLLGMHSGSGASLSLQMNAGHNMAGVVNVKNMGPVFSCSLPLMDKKLKTTFSWSHIVSQIINQRKTMQSLRFQLSRQWKIQSLQAMFQVQQSQGRGFLQATVGYQVVVK